jgi:quercetin dioxygenase-like cupin family protein
VTHDAEFLFLFVLEGGVTLRADGREEKLAAGDSATIPANFAHALVGPSADLEFLEVSLPATFATVRYGALEHAA